MGCIVNDQVLPSGCTALCKARSDSLLEHLVAGNVVRNHIAQRGAPQYTT